jgi:Uma2 family endonuclease
MASKTLVTVEEYLKSSFDGPEPDYLDGELIERHLGSKPHSEVQMRLLLFFAALSKSCSLKAYPELTLKLSPTRYRVADVAVLIQDASTENYPTTPPLVVAEVVSEDDRHIDIVKKLAQYHAWGVKHVWSVDPWTLKLMVYDEHGYHQVPVFELPEFGAKISAVELFADQTPQQ